MCGGVREEDEEDPDKAGAGTVGDVGFQRRLNLIPADIDYSLNPYPVLAHGLHGLPTWKGTTATRRLPSAPSSGRADSSMGDSVAR